MIFAVLHLDNLIRLYTNLKTVYNIVIKYLKGGGYMELESMTRDEMLKYEIDYFVNLMRIKKAETSTNAELEYQIKVQRNKLSTLGINTNNFEID
jgi:hypothetical protein